MENKIKKYLDKFCLDVRKTKDARFMDQKVTPDILSFISDCVINFLADDKKKEFTVRNIWDSQYFLNNVKAFFNKPDATDKTVHREVDKLIGQPLRALGCAQILKREKRGNKNIYAVKNYSILEHIAFKDKNAFAFLYYYIVKVLKDSNELRYFEEFKNLNFKGKVDDSDYKHLKDRFQKFLWGNTNISPNKKYEPRRIFPKVLNVYAVYNNIKGSKSGFLSKNEYYYSDLLYNKTNFRDIGKDKSVTRQQNKLSKEQNESFKLHGEYLLKKAMEIIRKKYKYSEIKDDLAQGDADQVHHIFSKSEFPQVAHYLENLIKLTASQHYQKAHSKNNTRIISKDYQLICLLSKAKSIQVSIQRGEFIYKKEAFIFVINTGLSENLKQTLSFNKIKIELSRIYNQGMS